MDHTAEKAKALAEQPQFDISDEKWRTYHYSTKVGLGTVTIYNPKTLILEKRDDGNDRHRVITKDGRGWYVRPGWLGIEWENGNADQPINF